MRFNRFLTAFAAAGLVLTSGGIAHASDANVTVADVVAPTGAVELHAGGSAPINITVNVTGNQAGTATFDVYRDWTLTGGAFVGSNPLEFSVGPRAGGAPTVFTTAGTVHVGASHTPGTYTLSVVVFDITNSNTTGAKLGAGAPGAYTVTVTAPSTPPPAPVNTAPGAPGAPVASASPTQGGFSLGWAPAVDAEGHAVTYTLEGKPADGSPWTVVGSGLTSPAHSFVAGRPGEGTWTYRVKAVEATTSPALAGEFSADSAPVVVDRTGPRTPTATADRPPEYVNGVGAWWKDAVTVSFGDEGDPDLADGSLGSGVASVAGPQVFDLAGAFAASGDATDHADNVSAAATFDGHVDADAPAVAVTCPTGVYFGDAASASWSATDGGSGVAGPTEGTLALDTTSTGAKTAAVDVADNVGHSTTGTCGYQVQSWRLSGFYSPVDMGAVVNTVKAGATVPLKFEAFAGARELTGTSIVTSFRQTRVTCDTAATVDEIEVTTTGGTALRYDWAGGQFVQNWQTPKISGACYRVTLTTQDGSSIAASFRLR